MEALTTFYYSNNTTTTSSDTTLTTSSYNSSNTLVSVVIGTTATAIGDGCFTSKNSLTSVTLPNTITSIGANCFASCQNLISINFPSVLTFIGNNCFVNCGFRNIDFSLSTSLMSLPQSCFQGNWNLTSVTLPPLLTTLYASCFRLCSRLTNITFPPTLNRLSSSCFDSCISLVSVIFENQSAFVGYGINVFAGCFNLQRVTYYNTASAANLTSTSLNFQSQFPNRTVPGFFIYYASNTGFSPTLSNFSIPTRNIGDAPFALTPPLSNSTSPFTYTSSNTSVAIVSGSLLIIVGPGTTVITATQPYTSDHEAGTIWTTFTVNIKESDNAQLIRPKLYGYPRLGSKYTPYPYSGKSNWSGLLVYK